MPCHAPILPRLTVRVGGPFVSAAGVGGAGAQGRAASIAKAARGGGPSRPPGEMLRCQWSRAVHGCRQGPCVAVGRMAGEAYLTHAATVDAFWCPPRQDS